MTGKQRAALQRYYKAFFRHSMALEGLGYGARIETETARNAAYSELQSIVNQKPDETITAAMRRTFPELYPSKG